MSLHDQTERVAYDLYEKGGRLDGKDTENWLEGGEDSACQELR